MGSGKPVVATWAGGVPDIVRDGDTSLLVEPYPSSIARRIITDLRNLN